MTQNTPGKIPITECSSESQHLQKHDVPVVNINACQVADFGVSHVDIERHGAPVKCQLKPMSLIVTPQFTHSRDCTSGTLDNGAMASHD